MEIIDAYTHCGVSKYLPIESVDATMHAAGVRRAVLVQHLGEFDNSYIGAVVARVPTRFVGVCLVDHRPTTAPEATVRLRDLVRVGEFRGVRFTADALRERPDLFAAAAELGAVIVFFAPDGIGNSLPALEAFLESSPTARLVVTHLGNPVADTAGVNAVRSALERLARFKGVYLQLSGLEMFCPYPHEPLHALIHSAVRAFGADRVLWGSNFPVVGGVEQYRRALAQLTEGRLPVPPAWIPAIAGDNAQRLWFEV